MKPILRTPVTVLVAFLLGFGLCLITQYRPAPKAQPITSPAKQHEPDGQAFLPQLTTHPEPIYVETA